MRWEKKLLKKFLSHLSEVSDLKIIIVRYLVNFVVLLEILFLPILLDPFFYTKIETIRQLFLFAPLVLFGANSGYLYCLYREKQNHQHSLLIFSNIFGFIIGFGIYLIYDSLIIASAIFLMIFVAAMEKILIVKKEFILASIYKAIISSSMLLIAIWINYNNINYSAMLLYSTSVVMAIIIWTYIIHIKLNSSSFLEVINFKKNINNFFHLIRRGFILSIQSYVLIAYFAFDRYVINKIYPEYSAEYALAFNLSQVIFIAINTITFSAQQKIGIKYEEFDFKKHKKMLFIGLKLFTVIFIIGLIGCYVYSVFVNSYGSFIKSFVIMAVLYGGYYIFSTVSIVGFYQGLAFSSLLIILLFCFINVICSWLIINFGGGYYLIILKSGLLLVLSAWVFDLIIRKNYQVS
jgi:hypothetical protein